MKGIIRPRMKKYLLERDGNKCFYCDDRFEPTSLTMEHVLSETDGGPPCPSNLVLACKPCNEEAGCLSVHGKVMLRETKARKTRDDLNRKTLIQNRQQLCKEKHSLSLLVNSIITSKKSLPSVKARLKTIESELADLNVKLGFNPKVARQQISQAMLEIFKETVSPEDWEDIKKRARHTIEEYRKEE